MKSSTMIATMLLSISIILAFFGTRFQGVPLNTLLSFWIMLVSVVVSSVGLLVAFRRCRWLYCHT